MELTRAGVSNKNKCMPLLKKKLYIRTFGCQMNQADSQQMARLLAPEYELTGRAEEAGTYILSIPAPSGANPRKSLKACWEV